MENITLRLDLLNDGRIVPLCYLTPEEKTIRVDRTLNYTTMQNEDNSLSHIITCRCGTRKIKFEVVSTPIGLFCSIIDNSEYST